MNKYKYTRQDLALFLIQYRAVQSKVRYDYELFCEECKKMKVHVSRFYFFRADVYAYYEAQQRSYEENTSIAHQLLKFYPDNQIIRDYLDLNGDESKTLIRNIAWTLGIPENIKLTTITKPDEYVNGERIYSFIALTRILVNKHFPK